MKWSELTWKQAEKQYQSILHMPFITELSKGTLPKEKFQFYMAQDAMYLEHFGRALALIGARAFDLQDVLTYIRFAENAIVVENALHEHYFKKFDITDKGKLQPICHHYIHFIKSTAALESVEIAMAAVLPCFWIYKKVGEHIYHNQQSDNNPYKKWIDTYVGEAFAACVAQAISICDKVAVNTTPVMRERMTEAFITASQLEYNFWEAAYELKSWI